MEAEKLSSGWRALYVILGIIAIAVGIMALVFPEVFVGVLAVVLAVGLLFNGISSIILAATAPLSTGLRVLGLITGMLALILFAIVIAVPGAAFSLIVIFLSIGLIFWGINRMVLDGANGELPGWVRGLGIVVGILALIMGFLVLAEPIFFGLGLAVVFLSLGLIFGGIAAIGSGAAGVKMVMNPPAQMA